MFYGYYNPRKLYALPQLASTSGLRPALAQSKPWPPERVCTHKPAQWEYVQVFVNAEAPWSFHAHGCQTCGQVRFGKQLGCFPFQDNRLPWEKVMGLPRRQPTPGRPLWVKDEDQPEDVLMVPISISTARGIIVSGEVVDKNSKGWLAFKEAIERVLRS